jgi:hypothetical protein
VGGSHNEIWKLRENALCGESFHGFVDFGLMGGCSNRRHGVREGCRLRVGHLREVNIQLLGLREAAERHSPKLELPCDVIRDMISCHTGAI